MYHAHIISSYLWGRSN